MAIYHLSVKPVPRAQGRSATASAAYRAAEVIHDRTTGETFDYRRKRGVEHAEIVLPTEATRRDINWARDREQLWNAAEKSENRSNSRVAREYEVALPHELPKAKRLELVRAFALDIANRHNVAVDFAIHAPHWHGDQRNHHAHIFATTRVIEPGDLGEKATIEWSDTNRRKAQLEPARHEIKAIRVRWEELANEKLLEHGIEARIDHRSLADQGLSREPTSHLGPAVSGMQRRGMETQVGERLDREALEAAQRRLERAAEIGKLAREERELSASILDLSGNIANAKRERDLALKGQGAPAPSMEELQRQGRERWLALRAEHKSQEKVPEQGAAKSIEQLEPSRSVDIERQQATERWREYRRGQELGSGREPGQQPERMGPEKDLDRDQEREGPEIEQ